MNLIYEAHPNARVTPGMLGPAVGRVTAADLAEVERVCDGIHREQPVALAHVVVLGRMGVPNELLDHGFHLLMVIHEACKAAGLPGRPITEDALEAALVKVGAKFSYLDGETERESWDRAISLDLQGYRETWLLAYTATYLRDHVCFAPGPDEAVSLLFQAVLALFHAYTDPAD